MAAENSKVGYGLHPFNDPAIIDEFYQESIDINASDYHIYAVEWAPTRVDFYIDNCKTRTVYQSPNYPMQFMLGIYEIPDRLTSAAKSTSWPKTFMVDYLRGYQPVAGYRQYSGKIS